MRSPEGYRLGGASLGWIDHNDPVLRVSLLIENEGDSPDVCKISIIIQGTGEVLMEGYIPFSNWEETKSWLEVEANSLIDAWIEDRSTIHRVHPIDAPL